MILFVKIIITVVLALTVMGGSIALSEDPKHNKIYVITLFCWTLSIILLWI